jgi:glycerol-3-phosphate dehydrogenase
MRRRGDSISGVHLIDARCVINAAGLFPMKAVHSTNHRAPVASLSVRARIWCCLPTFSIPTRGSWVPRTDEDRMLFAIPWNDRVLVGTTDAERPVPELERRQVDDVSTDGS